jgi:hypothetical protein
MDDDDSMAAVLNGTSKRYTGYGHESVAPSVPTNTVVLHGAPPNPGGDWHSLSPRGVVPRTVPVGGHEVEVTPEMMAAGLNRLHDTTTDLSGGRDIVRSIYAEMHALAPVPLVSDGSRRKADGGMSEYTQPSTEDERRGADESRVQELIERVAKALYDVTPEGTINQFSWERAGKMRETYLVLARAAIEAMPEWLRLLRGSYGC